MALRRYERQDWKVPPIIRRVTDFDELDNATLQIEIDEDQAKLDLDTHLFDEIFSEIGGGLSFNTPDKYRSYLQDRIDARKELLDYYTYNKTQINIWVADYKWVSGSDLSIESFCGEEGANPATNMIDGDNNTFWQHNTDEEHSIVIKLSDWEKRWASIRFRRYSNVRSALTNLTVSIANNISGLDKAERIAVTGVNLTLDADWNEVDFTDKRNGKYAKLYGFGSLESNNQARIREVEFKAITKVVEE